MDYAHPGVHYIAHSTMPYYHTLFFTEQCPLTMLTRWITNKLKSSVTHEKRSFLSIYHNAIFGKIYRIASKEVTIELISCKWTPILLYGLECFSITKHDVSSQDFVVTWFLKKLFTSININFIDECRLFCKFMLPSKKNEKKKNQFCKQSLELQ